MSTYKNICVTIISLLFLSMPVKGQLVRTIVADTVTYTVLISGHFHGSSTNMSCFPAGSLLANIDNIRSKKPLFIAALGDIFMNPDKDINNYKKSFFNKIGIPVVNSVGNHDISDSYNKLVGEPHYSKFTIGDVTHIFIDTEEDNGRIECAQLAFFKDALQTNVSMIFIYSHRPLWSEEDEVLKSLFADNTHAGTNYSKDILPLLKNCGKKIYWYSGSMGGSVKSSFFYHKFNDNITYIATAIRNLTRDGALLAHVNGSDVRFETFSFNDNKTLPLEQYNLEYWQRTSTIKKAEDFNVRLIPLYCKNIILHRYFWYGILFTFVVLGLLQILVQKIKKK